MARSRARISIGVDNIEKLRGKLVTAQDEVSWEQRLKLETNIEKYKYQLNMHRRTARPERPR